MALCSCVKTVDTGRTEPAPIFYQTVVSPVLKSDNGNIYPEDSRFMSAAFHNRPDSDSRDESSVYINGSEVALRAGVWTTEAKHYWPSEGSLSFLSYSPSGTPVEVVISKDGIAMNGWDVSSEAAKNIDFMVADVRVGESRTIQTGTGGNPSAHNGVPTIFRHKLSRVSVSVRGDMNGNSTASAIVIKAVRLTDIRTVGDYTGGAPGTATWTELRDGWKDSWTVRGEAGTVTLYSDANGHTVMDKSGYDPLGSAVMMIPQTLGPESGLEIEFTENGGEPVTASLEIPENHREWKIGHAINYAVSFNIGNIEFDVQTGNWTGTGSSITVGDKYNPGI